MKLQETFYQRMLTCTMAKYRIVRWLIEQWKR